MKSHSAGLPTNAMGFARVEGVNTRNNGTEIQLLVAGAYYAWSGVAKQWVRVGAVRR